MNFTQNASIDFIRANPGCNVETLAKQFNNRRVLPTKQTISTLLWSGKIQSFNGGYKAV